MENKIREAMCHLDTDLVQEAARPMVQKKYKFRTLLVAACLTALCIVGVAAASGGLLVQFYHNGNMPDSLPDDKVDAYYEVSGNEKIALDRFSKELRTCAAEQGVGGKHYPFETLSEIEAFLGQSLPENTLLADAAPVPVELTLYEGGEALDAPGAVYLLNDREGRLVMVMASYVCRTGTGQRVFLTASAATVDNPNGSIGSMGVDYEDGGVLQQKAEVYLTASGRECTIVRTQNSLTKGWDIYSWLEQDGFVLRLSLSEKEEAAAQTEMKLLLDAFQ